jgi:sterol desaturase/sphingolipid hydroxylase (fatty acid hydroxylase superfamily)
MFASDFFDLFSRTHWGIVPALYVPATLLLAYRSIAVYEVTWWATILLALAGIVMWTLTEYWLHRTLFHWIPETKWGPRMHFFLHGVHHDWPSDKYRLVMPPAVSISLFFVFGALWIGLLGAHGWAIHAGYTIGYMIYDMTHYYVHWGKPKSKFFRMLRRHHMSHHFNDKFKERRYGVSNRFWDKVFGTA